MAHLQRRVQGAAGDTQLAGRAAAKDGARHAQATRYINPTASDAGGEATAASMLERAASSMKALGVAAGTAAAAAARGGSSSAPTALL